MSKLPTDIFELIGTLTTFENWPELRKVEKLEELEKKAEDAFRASTFEGYLSYVYIVHQICDEYIRLLIWHARFTTKLYLIEHDFDFKFSKDDGIDDLYNNRLTTGALLEALTYSLEFEEKSEFIESCRKLVNIRNDLVHRLTGALNLDKIQSRANNYRSQFKELQKLFFSIHNILYLLYKDQRKDGKWNEYLEMLLDESSDNPDDVEKIQKLIDIRKNAVYTITLTEDEIASTESDGSFTIEWFLDKLS